MANVYLVLPVPAGDGAGAGVDVSTMAAEKTISVDGGPFSGTLYIEASNDGQTSWAPVSVEPFTSDGQVPGKTIASLQFMRVRRAGSIATALGAPSVKAGADAGTGVYGAMAVPAGNGVGALIDLSAGGVINTFNVVGPGPAGQEQLLIEVSTDAGTTWSPAIRFGAFGQVGQTYQGVVSSARVRRQFVSDGAPVPHVSVGSSDPNGGGTGPGGEVLQFDSLFTVGSLLSAYVTTGKPKGQTAYVGNDTFANNSSVQDFFSLAYGENLIQDGRTVVNSPTFAVDGAQWKRMFVVNQKWLRVTDWYLYTGGGVGSDEYTGTSADFPLATMVELNRRLVGSNFKNIVVRIHQMNDMPFAAFTPLTNVNVDWEADGRVIWMGELDDVLLTDVVTSYTPHTDVDENALVVPGIGAFGNGALLVRHDGGGAPTAFAWGLGTFAADACWLSGPRFFNLNGSVGVGNPVDLAPGDEISMYALKALRAWPFPSTSKGFICETVHLVSPNSSIQGATVGQLLACLCGDQEFYGGSDLQVASCCFTIENRIHGGDLVLAGCATNAGLLEIQGGASVRLLDEFAIHNAGSLHVNDGSTVQMVQDGSEPDPQLGIFDIAGGTAAIVCRGGGRFLNAAGTLYGDDNAGKWLDVEAGSECAIGTIVGSTTDGLPLTVAATNYPTSALPIIDAKNIAAIIGPEVPAIVPPFPSAAGSTLIAQPTYADMRALLGIVDVAALARQTAFEVAAMQEQTFPSPPVVFWDDLTDLLQFSGAGGTGSGIIKQTGVGGRLVLTTTGLAASTARRYLGDTVPIIPPEANKKWMCEVYAKLTTAIDGNTLLRMGADKICCGVEGPNSTAKWSFRAQAGFVDHYLTSTVNIDVGVYHRFRFGCTGALWWFSVDGEARQTTASLLSDGSDFGNFTLDEGASAVVRSAEIDWIGVASEPT